MTKKWTGGKKFITIYSGLDCFYNKKRGKWLDGR